MTSPHYWQTLVWVDGHGPWTHGAPAQPCWRWCSVVSDFGFPMYAAKGARQVQAARYVAEQLQVLPIPDGLTACPETGVCVNPWHQQATARRGKPNPFTEPPAPCGHVLGVTGVLVRITPGGTVVRDCRKCLEIQRDKEQAYGQSLATGGGDVDHNPYRAKG